MGLREQKKSKRRHRVLEAAEALFHERGFAGSTISAVAARADLAVGTVYNYFSSKDVLFVAVLKRELERLGASDRVNPDLDAPGFVMEAFSGVLSLVEIHGRELWFEFMMAVFHARRTLDEPVFELDWMLIQEIQDRLGFLRDQNRVVPGQDLERASMVIFGCFLLRFQMYLMTKEVSIELFRHELFADVEMIVNGLSITSGRSRNE